MFVKFFQNGTSFSFPVRYINKITRYRLVAALPLCSSKPKITPEKIH